MPVYLVLCTRVRSHPRKSMTCVHTFGAKCRRVFACCRDFARPFLRWRPLTELKTNVWPEGTVARAYMRASPGYPGGGGGGRRGARAAGRCRGHRHVAPSGFRRGARPASRHECAIVVLLLGACRSVYCVCLTVRFRSHFARLPDTAVECPPMRLRCFLLFRKGQHGHLHIEQDLGAQLGRLLIY